MSTPKGLFLSDKQAVGVLLHVMIFQDDTKPVFRK